MNDRSALDLLLARGPLSRTRIGTLTGLSKPTASQLLARLESAGLVVVSGRSEGRPGPNAQLYEVNPRAAHVAALDVTTAGIRAAVADITGRTVGRYTLDTTAGDAPDGTAEQVAAAVEGAAADAGVDAGALHRIVIGTPGAFDPGTGRLRYASHLPGWHSPTLLDEIAAAVHAPVRYENDVNLAAVAEWRLGAAQGREDFVLLWNEQGIGAAVVLGGRLHRGRTGGAGEVGFLPVPGAPLVRDPGRRGSGGYQELAGAEAVLRAARELGLPHDPSAEPKDAAAALLSAAARVVGPGHAPATDGAGERGVYRELLGRFAAGLAVGLAAVVTVLDPQLVVLAGGLPQAGGEPLRARVEGELGEIAVPVPRVVLGTVTDGPVLGGALQSALATTRDEVFDTSA
ncbi:ROK family transcriptional regulator [Streptomyces sp. HNM0574]|uniref:ROK family transcriptional regulator n=1 Tax=Streptomyces sp. HNM0574 TaxID=2714954 RepID=UPI00146CB98C|nr:ROK family transcriptional regulator [Streptomyces sp. HNM0574]NLU66409.1 ROK family transcriptional regulator [Streptomyces sp. HNM0574]